MLTIILRNHKPHDKRCCKHSSSNLSNGNSLSCRDESRVYSIFYYITFAYFGTFNSLIIIWYTFGFAEDFESLLLNSMCACHCYYYTTYTTPVNSENKFDLWNDIHHDGHQSENIFIIPDSRWWITSESQIWTQTEKQI